MTRDVSSATRTQRRSPIRIGWVSRVALSPLALVLAMVLTLLGTTLGSALAQDATPNAATASPAAQSTFRLDEATAALIAQQGDDGGFVGFSGESDPGTTADAILALVAAEQAGIETGDSLERALAYLEGAGLSYAQTGYGQRAKIVLAVDAAGGDAFDFAGTDLWEPLEQTDFESGVVGQGFFDHSLATLAAVAVGSDRTDEFARTLIAGQLGDGSWGWASDAVEGEGDTNTTALAVQALVAAGDGDDPAIDAALAYLDSARGADGGYGYQPATTPEAMISDANSTALVIQAFLAVGLSPDDEPLASALAALAAFQNESGSVRFNDEMPDDNLFSLVQAIPAAAGVPYPVFETVAALAA